MANGCQSSSNTPSPMISEPGESSVTAEAFGANFNFDSSVFSQAQAQIKAAFYPKFENEDSAKKVRKRMIDMVSRGQAILEVSLKHSGSLFMYAGHESGAYAKNSFGNMYTAVGVFVLGRTFLESWGVEGRRKQRQFNDFIEENCICVSMELVTAVLEDHGQRPIDDYVVVTAVAELGHGRPKFYPTLDLIAFCKRWRLPTNHIWLFFTRESTTSFFAAYDALREEGTATSVLKSLDEVADMAVPGSKDYVKVQGEILEGLVARVVNHCSYSHVEKVIKDFHPPPTHKVGLDLGPSLREIFAANRSDGNEVILSQKREEKELIKTLLESAGNSICPDFSYWLGNAIKNDRDADPSMLTKFLRSRPMDLSTTRLQDICKMIIRLCRPEAPDCSTRPRYVAELIKEDNDEEIDQVEMKDLMKPWHCPAVFKCYYRVQKIKSLSSSNFKFKMIIQIRKDSIFKSYQQKTREKLGSWPLYRGFFVDINLNNIEKDSAAKLAIDNNSPLSNIGGSCDSNSSSTDELSDENEYVMIKLKFLTYKLRTFLIRNGLSVLLKNGRPAYKIYYMRLLNDWGISDVKKEELSKMLDEWALYIKRKYGTEQLSSARYLTEAEPFLDQYAKHSLDNQESGSSAGNLVRANDLLAIIKAGKDEDCDIHLKKFAHANPLSSIIDVVPKDEGLIIIFPGIPGCAKSALCEKILNIPSGLGDNRPVHSLMGDLIKISNTGDYWQYVANEHKKQPYGITLADKNAPNKKVWRKIKGICRETKASAVPVVPDSEGTNSNPFSLDALAVFLFRVLQRVNHPGKLDRDSPNAGYVLLVFYHLYDGKNSKEFESELRRHFGALIKMPLLKADRSPLPDPLKDILHEGINLYKLHTSRHGRSESYKCSYAEEWARWEKKLREIFLGNVDHLNSIQVPFDFACKQVIEQLKDVAKSTKHETPATEKNKFCNIVFSAITLPCLEIISLLDELAKKDLKAKDFLEDKKLGSELKKAHVTLAHRRSHDINVISSYDIFVGEKVPIDFTALVFSDKVAALEVQIGSVNGERITSKNEWPHVTVWTAAGTTAKEANKLARLLSEGNATRIVIEPHVAVWGVLDLY